MGNPAQLDFGGIAIVASDFLISSSPGGSQTDLTSTGLASVSGVTAGTVSASKAVIVDSSKNITGFNNITLGGNLTLSAAAGLLFESFTDSITAHSGGGQGSALALTSEVNRITTAAATASPFDSVALPAATAGLTVMVINHGANPIQVFGAGTDTIDDVATATGVTQMAGSVSFYVCTTSGPAGKWYSEGIGTGYSGGLQTFSVINGLTAAGANQGGALALVNTYNRVTTTAAGTGVKLPASAPGLEITISNQGANPVIVYGNGSDTVDGAAGATGYIQVAGSVATYFCAVAGTWESDKSNSAVSGRVFHSGLRAPATNADFTNTTPVATTSYIVEVFVPANFTATGIAVVNGTAVSGNVTVFLADHMGNNLAHSASTAQSGTSAYQRIPFTATYAVRGPATYYLVQQIDNTTGRIATHPFGNFGATSIGSGTYGTFPAGLVGAVPSTFTTNVGPVASLY